MKKVILILTIVFSGMLIQAQPKNATTIIVQDTNMNAVIDYLTEHDVIFFKIDNKRGTAISEEFPVECRDMARPGTIKLIEKQDGIYITGSVENLFTMPYMGSSLVDIQMINKRGFAGGHVGGTMFRQIDSILKQKFNIKYI